MRIGVGTQGATGSGLGVDGVIGFLTTETWLAISADGHPVGRIAEGWSWDAAATTLRLSLRPKVFFHDATPLTPELAAESLRASIAKREAGSLSDVTSVKAVGSNAIELHLSEPNSFLLSDLALVNVMEAGPSPSETGPYVLESRDTQQAVLRSFNKYYRGMPGLSEINVRAYPTQRSAWASLMRGDIDTLYEVSRDAAEFVKAESTVHTYSFIRPYYISLVFNVRHPVLRNPAVRKALNEALDRDVLVADGLNGWGRPADGPIPPEHWAYSRGAPIAFNADAARQQLDAAGYPLKRVVEGTVPTRFSFTCLVFADDSRFNRVAVLVQKQLADIGVEMKLQPVQSKDLAERLKNGDFDAFLFEMAGRSLSWVYQFWHSHEGGRLNSGYHAADAALDELKAARSEDDVRSAVAKFTRIIQEDPPAAFLAWQRSSRAVSARFDVRPEKDRDPLANIWQWRLAAPDLQVAK